ncbi:hypothetical protein [Nonomuraea pusilla]|uniref:Phage Mu protein F like protein n=1 Tax=Nonomuraea pusilla TaxID=46177 RepID=A0A1H8JYS1_9ACTN|nr:hypothetical protein [Nonomuraea pusilla]SEN85701.1 hypothetical protein SAMN05660976_08474 [Nonomuraea pusilla]
MAAQQIAQAHYQAQQAVVRSIVDQGQTLWATVRAADVLDSWLAALDTIIQILTLGQRAAASLSQPYVAAVAREQGVPQLGAGVVNPGAFAGVAADGRDLRSLLMQPALRALGLLAVGVDDQLALRSGLARLTRILETETTDAGRVADGVGMVANRRFVSYVRMLTPPSCGRCIVLAGRAYSWSTGFARHPNCDCYHLPIPEGSPERLLVQSPREAFDGMSREQQNRAFGKSAAEAIRDGGDIAQVVNARRRGATYVAGGREYTREGTTRRGLYGAGREPRPTPEQIYRDAAGDRGKAIGQLRRFGYLI